MDPTRSAGILLHITSLPGGHGTGDLGASAHRFVEWLARAGMRAWQTLPLVPPDHGASPYSSWSAFAGNPWVIDLHGLVVDGLLDPGELAEAPPNGERMDFAAVRAFKGPRLARAADRLLRATHPLRAPFDAWRAGEAWVDEAGLFDALKARAGGAAWWDWDAPLRSRDTAALATARAECAAEIDRFAALQFLFERQWATLRAHAHAHRVAVIGDLPIYVALDSVDVWADQGDFELDADGRPTRVAGVPPDAFSETGQLWGNPLYRWERMAADGYGWWVARLRRTLALFDRVRIDHFRAFSAYWAVPAEEADARRGAWVPGPGAAFFDAMRAALGDLPILAEDLGVIDEPVRALLAATGMPGMSVLQFAFDGDVRNRYLPHNQVPNSVVYTGTHDNDTSLGWWFAQPEHIQAQVRHYFGVDGHDFVWDFVRAALASVAETAIIPMQDALALGADARMNTPATCEGNWSWRLVSDGMRGDVADRLRFLNGLYGRMDDSAS